MTEKINEDSTATEQRTALSTRELEQLSDEELARLFQQEFLPAFDTLVRRYKDPLMNYLFRFVGDYDTATDLLQETFIKLYEKKHLYKQIAKFSTWIYTVAGNLARSEIRSRKRHTIFSIFSHDSEDEESMFPLPDDQPLPDRMADSALLGSHIENALRRIHPFFREAIILSDVQDLTYPEIAEITQVPIGTVKSRINRGRLQLKQLLQDVNEQR